MPQRTHEEEGPSQSVSAAAHLAQTLAGPLDSLMAMGELLQRQSLPEAARGQLKAMLDAGRRMRDVVCDAVETPNLMTPQVAVSTSLRALIDDLDAHWRSAAGQDGSRVLISSNAPPDLRVMVDPVRLRRLLNSLIQDALDTGARGVIEMQLTIASGTGGSICIQGRLNAPGAVLSSREPSAFHLCRTIVEQTGGDLTWTERAGCGVETRFSVRTFEMGLDAAADADDGDGSPLPPGAHLLIVDDNATNRIVAAALCEMFGCTAETAEDGLEAVEAVKSRPFDLILMDIKMPRMDGLLATRTIRALPSAAAAIPIIALTANADAEAAASYLAAGMQAVVNKPIKPDQLLATLQWALCRPVEPALLNASVA